MNAGVIDTSALVKYVLPEEHSEYVRNLIILLQSSRLKLMAPDYALVESANVLWKHVQRNNLLYQDAASGLKLIQQAGIELVPQIDLLDDALFLAAQTNITVYDALFAVLAQRERIPLITADRQLVNRLADTVIQAIMPNETPW